jgi:hypothetical protein
MDRDCWQIEKFWRTLDGACHSSGNLLGNLKGFMEFLDGGFWHTGAELET